MFKTLKRKHLTISDHKTGTNVMNTSEIESILQRNEAVRDTFLGVYALDRLPSKLELDDIRREQESIGLPNRWFLICNCCPSAKIGRHWVAMFSDNGSVEFFDSFAQPPNVYNDGYLIKFLTEASEGRDVIYNIEPLQAIETDACGHYCIVYGVARSLGVPFNSFINEMSSLTRDNLIKFVVSTLF